MTQTVVAQRLRSGWLELYRLGSKAAAQSSTAFPGPSSPLQIEDTPAVPHAMSQGGTLWLNCVWRMSHTQRQPLQPRTLNALLPPGCSALVPLTRLELSCVELPSQVAACSQLSSLACLTVCDCYTWDRDPAPADNSDSDSDGDEEAAEAAQHGISNSTLASLLQQTPQLRELSIKECLAGDPAVLNSAVLPPGLTCLSLRCNYLSAAPEGPYPPGALRFSLLSGCAGQWRGLRACAPNEVHGCAGMAVSLCRCASLFSNISGPGLDSSPLPHNTDHTPFPLSPLCCSSCRPGPGRQQADVPAAAAAGLHRPHPPGFGRQRAAGALLLLFLLAHMPEQH